LKSAIIAAIALAATIALGAGAPEQTQPSQPPAPAAPPAANPAEPQHIEVQHCLVSFSGTPAARTPRTQEEAKKLAYEILERAKKGEDFGALVKKYTDDQYPGIYRMANDNVKPSDQAEYPRRGMVAAFGDVGFALKVGEYGIADFDLKKSPFGYHVIKRLK